MENENSNYINRYKFFHDKKTVEVFAKIDYLLRSSVHIQRNYPLPGELFRFISRNFESLKAYYLDIFDVLLKEEGSEFSRYYFIDFEERNRGNIAIEHREYLKTEYIIIGMLYFKLYKIDGNIDLDSVSEFKTLLFSEYEEEKDALRKLIADVTGDKSSDYSDQKIEEVIRKAFGKFQELGWIAWEDDQERDKFIYMPSFERLRLMYQPQITGIDELIKKLNNGK